MNNAENGPVAERVEAAPRQAQEPSAVEVTNVDRAERRISLSLKQAKRTKQKEEYAQYLEDTSSAVTFGDLLQQQLNRSRDDE